MLSRLESTLRSQVVLAAVLFGLLISPIYTVIAEESSGSRSSKKAAARAPVPDEGLVVSCHVVADKKAWAVDKVPRFKVCVRHGGSERIELVTNPDLGCMVEVDGAWYAYAEPQWVDGFDRYSTDWIAKNGGYLSFVLDPINLKDIENGQRLKLAPGKHKVCFAWAEYEREEPPRLISKAVTIAIEKPGPPSRPAAKYTRERQVHDLFAAYVAQREKNSEQLRFDIQLHSQWRPRFVWSDIPILLKIAESKRVMKGNIPSRMISSYAAMECTEGMVALWFIEGLRRKQLDLMARERGSQSYPGFNARWYYNLPFNPFCMIEGLTMRECEASPEVHSKTLRAYKAWWKKVGSLTPADAAVVNPLADTEVTWSSRLHPMDKAILENSTSERP